MIYKSRLILIKTNINNNNYIIINRFINQTFLQIQTYERSEISRFINDFISKVVIDFAKLWNIVNI